MAWNTVDTQMHTDHSKWLQKLYNFFGKITDHWRQHEPDPQDYSLEDLEHAIGWDPKGHLHEHRRPISALSPPLTAAFPQALDHMFWNMPVSYIRFSQALGNRQPLAPLLMLLRIPLIVRGVPM